MGIEYERKFRADRSILLEINATFSEASREISMETVYYDTPSGALSAKRYTLRRRLENGVSVCTLKVPAGDARGEWETENVFIENAVPTLIADGAPEELKELVKEGLLPICGAKFTRLAKTITLENAVAELALDVPTADGMAELALDHGYLFSGDRKEPLCEVELELKSGDKGCFDRYVLKFAGEFALEEEKTSKFARALQLYRGE